MRVYTSQTKPQSKWRGLKMDAQVIHALLVGVAGPSFSSSTSPTSYGLYPLHDIHIRGLIKNFGRAGNMVQRWRQLCFRWRPPLCPRGSYLESVLGGGADGKRTMGCVGS